MYSGVRGQSQSMSCSTVNGKTICNRQTSPGGSAMASSSSFSGQQGSSQQTYAGAGDPSGQWDSSEQKVYTGDGGRPPSSDYFDFDRTEFQGAPRGFDGPFDGGSSYSSSGSAKNFGTDAGPGTVVGGFGFASAGNVFRPQFPNFVPGTTNTPQDSSEPNGRPPVRNNFGVDNSGFQVSTERFGGPPVRKNSFNDNSGFQVSTAGFGSPPVRNNFGVDNSGFQVSTERFGGSPVRKNSFNDNSGFQVSTERFGGPPVRNNFGNNNSGFQVSTGGFAGGPSIGGMSYSYSSSGSAPNFGTNEGPMSTAGGFGGAYAGGYPGGAYAGGYPGGFAGGWAGGYAGPGNFGPGGGQPFDPFRFVFGRR